MDYRIGSKQDIPIMFRIRKQQLIDEGISPESGIDKELSCCFEKKMSDGSPVEWLLVQNEETVATAAIMFIEFPPTHQERPAALPDD